MLKCAVCGSTSNLNTSITFISENGNSSFTICDEHMSDSLADIKSKCDEANQAILDLIAKAKELGLEIVPPGLSSSMASLSTSPGGVITAVEPPTKPQEPPTKPQVAVPTPEPKKPSPQDLGPEYVDTERLDNNRGMASVGGSTQMGAVDSYNSLSLDSLQDKLPPEVRKGVAKMALVDGVAGQKIYIPEQRRDGTGTTSIQIVKSTDDQLQESFRRMADESRGDNTPNFARSGYANTTRTCPLCRGDGYVSNQVCPKCKGTGIIPTYS